MTNNYFNEDDDTHTGIFEDDSNDNDISDNNVFNYKGYFAEENDTEGEEEEGMKYYEHGAHFSYYALYHRLEALALERIKSDYTKNNFKSKHKQCDIIKQEAKRSVTDGNNLVNKLFNTHKKCSRNVNANYDKPSSDYYNKENSSCIHHKHYVKTQHTPYVVFKWNNGLESKDYNKRGKVLETKTDSKAKLYSILNPNPFGIKGKKVINFINQNDRAIMLKANKTVQYSNTKHTVKKVVNSNNNDCKTKSEPLSLLLNNNYSSNNQYQPNGNQIPKSFLDIFIKCKQRHGIIYYSSEKKNNNDLKNKGTRVLTYYNETDKAKKYAIKSKTAQLINAIHGLKKDNKQPTNSPYKLLNTNILHRRTNSNCNTQSNKPNNPQKTTKKIKNKDELLLSISETIDHLSRNFYINNSILCKSITHNKPKIPNCFTNSNINRRQFGIKSDNGITNKVNKKGYNKKIKNKKEIVNRQVINNIQNMLIKKKGYIKSPNQ